MGAMGATTSIKAISLWEPWATLIAAGIKTYETRGWYTNWRGELLICATKKKTGEQRQQYSKILSELKGEKVDIDGFPCFENLSFGHAIAVVNLSDCLKMTDDVIQETPRKEIITGDWSTGRFAWKLENIRPLNSRIPVLGKQGFFFAEIPTSVIPH
jgi:hypothetical protein